MDIGVLAVLLAKLLFFTTFWFAVKSKIYTIDEKSGLRVIIYEFDSPIESRSIYDEQVNEIKKRGGYTEFEVPTYFHGVSAQT